MTQKMDAPARYCKAKTIPAVALTKLPRIGHVADELKLIHIPTPRPSAKQVTVQLVASSMHIDEIYAAQGTALGRFYGPKNISLAEPYLMGTSVSGVVVATGKYVKRFKVGDEVTVIPNELGENGSWATYRNVPERYVMPKPPELTHVEASSLMLSSCVAWGALETANVKAGDRCVVVGASGAIGSVLVQLLKTKSAYVVGVCSAANSDLVRTLGADEIIDYQQSGFTMHRERRTDKVFDLVGGLRVENAAYRWLKQDGEFVTMVGPVRYLGERKLTLKEFTRAACYVAWRSIKTRWRGPKYTFCAMIPRRVAPKAMQFCCEHGIRSPIEGEIPFELGPIQDAIRLLTTHRARGRVVINFELAAQRAVSQENKYQCKRAVMK
ncbi:NADP-dependent oxidoreductase [Pseudovibrio brasiliensis]|uniref:NADP-dependent oxidoreductase n=1 Tax=Pseudovibrio brasiliensis TaxID=1898042 RepID=A0ABX8AMR7_9HYPH|nr:NADP-dependent oxidoreductase [Pseudovibrio brasiliensis]QUS56303.1 NADP-dependent oxidoreductase [Pseudovibrio brasiliensis]